MFGLGRGPCAACDRQVPKKEALRVRDRKDLLICQSCYDRWDRGGRTCVQCQTPVRGPQEIGVFLDRYTFGHADCGASLLHRS